MKAMTADVGESYQTTIEVGSEKDKVVLILTFVDGFARRRRCFLEVDSARELRDNLSVCLQSARRKAKETK